MKQAFDTPQARKKNMHQIMVIGILTYLQLFSEIQVIVVQSFVNNCPSIELHWIMLAWTFLTTPHKYTPWRF